MSDVNTTDASKREMMLLSRCLAAFALSAVAQCDDLTAAESVVDEFQDHGIDAFYYDRREHIAYIVQSKWISNGAGSVDAASVLKFVSGIEDFIKGDVAPFGPKLRSKDADIQEAVTDSQASFVVILAYTGRPPLSPEAKKPLDKLLKALNQDSETFSLRALHLKDLHSIVETGVLGAPVNLTVMLKDFGVMREPYRSFYGQVNVADILGWKEHGDRLYHKNIRSFKGNTDVNESIVSTVAHSPENFFYFNNGITLLCSQLLKQPMGGASTDVGVFDCKGASVINGAQTVGSIISALSGEGVKAPNAHVLVKLISLEGCPTDFASEITRATNTQNKIEKRDFAALDQNQARLKSELFLTFRKEYSYRAGDSPIPLEHGCTLDEATVALACAQTDINYAVDAKTRIGKLYEDITKPPYTVLFNASLTAGKLWQAVQVMRGVDEFLKGPQSTREGRDRLTAVHGNRVLLHLVFRKLGRAAFDDSTHQREIGRIPQIAADLLEQMTKEVTNTYASSYPANIFKSPVKCREIVAAIR